MKLRKILLIILSAICMLGVLPLPPHDARAAKASAEFKPKTTVSKKERDKYFSESAFVGNSISKGLKIYFDSQGGGFLGNPVMLVQGSYSFINDKRQGSEYQLTYKGQKLQAKDAIAAARVKRVFINMGTNDLWKPSSQTYLDYVDYVSEIRRRNPKVIIFIQGTTPICGSRDQKYLNNAAIRDLNERMEKYCSKNKDMYYVNVSRGLETAGGQLKSQYSSDGFVHMTMVGYKMWTDNLIAYVNTLILQEKNAAKAVDRAEKSETQEDYDTAKAWVYKLEKSTTKQKLKVRLQRLKSKIEKPVSDQDEEEEKPVPAQDEEQEEEGIIVEQEEVETFSAQNE